MSTFIRDVFASPSEGAERYDTDQPWICWTFLSTDARTRLTSRSVIQESHDAIPPAYTELIGYQLLQHIRAVAA